MKLAWFLHPLMRSYKKTITFSQNVSIKGMRERISRRDGQLP
jgi:hypothetical protein